ncbi:hypothetical protein [Dyella sp.]|uniref:hypothetical protein n=1 Tax=Dyella sp. TaxID=1869338 RepID=UPI0039C88F38
MLSVERQAEGGPGLEGTIKMARFAPCGREFKCSDSPVKHDFSCTPANPILVELDTAESLDHASGRLRTMGKC